MGRQPGSVFQLLAANGGIVPRRRVRAARCLSFSDREEISRGLAAGDSFGVIAGRLGRPCSTVSREVGGVEGRAGYRAVEADQAAWDRARRPKPCRLAVNPTLRDVVAERLALRWSPQQVSRWLVRAYPGDDTMRVSHETIYKTLFIQSRGALKKELIGELRHTRRMRKSRNASKTSRPTGIKNAVSIRERPAEAEDRAVPGHWEGDLIAGKKNTYILTLVERHSRYVMLAKIDSKHTATVVAALTQTVQTLPTQLRRSLTWDRGTEMADHARFSIDTNVSVYFCDPHSPWQRGSNENTNGLLRQYFPKGTDLSIHTQDHLNDVAHELNGRPRQTLNWQNPAATLDQALVATTS